MSRLDYKTIAGERPQGKPNVYFSCHPDDMNIYFEKYASMILRIQDCAIWYESEPYGEYDREDLELSLSQMQFLVMPVTTKLLTEPNRAMDLEYTIAKENHIPVLPLMMEQGLNDLFGSRFGDMQFLDPNDSDETRRSFDDVLSSYIKSILLSNEQAEKVRAAFDAYIFLSYRKKDRRKAQELMRLIHRIPLCRDIAIWYDEFLTPGEDYNVLIEEMLRKSDIFAMAVTPNLVNEVNYVMTTEYPEAQKLYKLVMPVEMVPTDRGKLEECYNGLPSCVPAEDSEALFEQLRKIAREENDKCPEHNYLIGLAFLDGIDVEVDADRALTLITGAAEAGVPEAMLQLAVMYENGKGTKRDYYKGAEWRGKYVETLRKAYEEAQTEDTVSELLNELWNLGGALYALRMFDKANEVYSEMEALSVDPEKRQHRRILSAICYKLGDIARAMGNLAGAQEYYENAQAMDESLAEKTGSVDARRNLSISYNRLGDLAQTKGNLAKAKEYFEKALDICKALAEETGTVKFMRDMSLAYNRLGGLAKAMGDLESAQEYYEKFLSSSKELVEETGTKESLNDLSVSYERLGVLAMKMGDLSSAQEYYEKGLTIKEELAEETGTIESRRSLFLSYYNLGDLTQTKGNLAKAKDYFEKALDISKSLAEETGTVKSRRDMSLTYNRLGGLAKKKGDLESAQEYYEKFLSISKELAEETGTKESLNDLSVSYQRLGDLAKKMGDLAASHEYYDQYYAIKKKLADM